jgi:hypothetical protein
MSNPDPKGYMMAAAEKRAENEVKGSKSVAQLLSSNGESDTLTKESTDKKGEVIKDPEKA